MDIQSAGRNRGFSLLLDHYAVYLLLVDSRENRVRFPVAREIVYATVKKISLLPLHAYFLRSDTATVYQFYSCEQLCEPAACEKNFG
jgi:hypothetical protein